MKRRKTNGLSETSRIQFCLEPPPKMDLTEKKLLTSTNSSLRWSSSFVMKKLLATWGKSSTKSSSTAVGMRLHLSSLLRGTSLKT